MPLSDPTRLLRQYLLSGESRDFEELVKSYHDLVFGVAWRSTQSRSLAEDVTQEVFIILAQKAKGIREPEKLVGWLHKTTTLCAMNTNRKEVRRKRAMKTYSEELKGSVFSSLEEEAKWRQALPVLDATIAELPSSDREAILLRFYEERSFKSIGQVLGKSEEACRKKVNRAVERLSVLLRKKRVTVGSSVLLASLSSSLKAESLSREASSSEVARLAVESKVASGVGATTQILSLMSGYKITIAAAALLALIPPGLKWKENRELVSSQRAIATDHNIGNSRSQGTRVEKLTVEGTSRNQDELLIALSAISDLSSSYEQYTEVEYFALSLSRKELPLILAVLQGEFSETKGLSETVEYILWKKLFLRWAQLDSDEALAVAKTLLGSEHKSEVCYGIVEGLAGSDPEGTRQFLEFLPEGKPRERLMQISWNYHAKEHPEEALQMALKIEDLDEQVSIMDEVVHGVREVDPELGLAYIEKLEDGIDKNRWLSMLVGNFARSNPQEAYGYIVRSSDETSALDSLPYVLKVWAGRDPEGSLQVLSALDEQNRNAKAFESYGRGLTKIEDAERAFQQLQDQKEKAALLSGFASSYRNQASHFEPPTSNQLGELRELVESLPKGSYRKQADWDFAWVWALRNPGEANEWVQESSGIDQRLKKRFSVIYDEPK